MTAATPIPSSFTPAAQLADDGSDTVLTAGGRVLACVGMGESVAEARARAYRRANRIDFTDAYYRQDIAAAPAMQPIIA